MSEAEEPACFDDQTMLTLKDLYKKVDEKIELIVEKRITKKIAKRLSEQEHEMRVLQLEERMFNHIDSDKKLQAWQDYLADKRDKRKHKLLFTIAKYTAIGLILLLGGTQAAIEFGAKIFGVA